MNIKNLKTVISVLHPEFDVKLKMIDEADIDNLREWKNAERNNFFFNKIITVEQQREWLEAYQKRMDDFMYIILVNDLPIGCMGIRLKAE